MKVVATMTPEEIAAWEANPVAGFYCRETDCNEVNYARGLCYGHDRGALRRPPAASLTGIGATTPTATAGSSSLGVSVPGVREVSS